MKKEFEICGLRFIIRNRALIPNQKSKIVNRKAGCLARINYIHFRESLSG